MKTQNSIWINTRKKLPTDIDDFLTAIFYDKLYKKDKTGIQVRNTAEYILRKIIYESFRDTDKKACLEACRVSEGQYYTILSRLKSCGLIEKKEEEYIIKKQFSKSLNYLSNYWESIYYKWKENHKQERISFRDEEPESEEYKNRFLPARD